MKREHFCMYSKKTGLEIGVTDRKWESRGTEGRVVLRFFRLEEGASSFRFVMEPWESFDLARKIVAVHASGGKEKVTHRFEKEEGEVVTTLAVEKWERDGRTGCALTIQRDAESINVPLDEGRFLFAAEFLRHLATSQAWIDFQPRQPQAS